MLRIAPLLNCPPVETAVGVGRAKGVAEAWCSEAESPRGENPRSLRADSASARADARWAAPAEAACCSQRGFVTILTASVSSSGHPAVHGWHAMPSLLSAGLALARAHRLSGWFNLSWTVSW